MSERSAHSHPVRRLGKAALIVALWFVVWELVALFVDNQWLLCAPLDACRSWLELAVTIPFWLAIAHSLGRIALGFAVAFALGVLLGYAAAKLPLLRDFIKPAVAVVKSAPVVCIIALLLVGTGAHAATSIVVGLVVFPQFYHAVLQATLDRDEELDEVLRIFGVTALHKVLFVEFVALGTSIRAACATAAGLAWKSGIAAEIIGLPALSIGTGVYLAKISLDSATIIAWTATVILLSWLSEKLLLWLVGLLLRMPKHALARRVERALQTESTSNEKAAAPACGLVIDELERDYSPADGSNEKRDVLIYKSIAVAPGERVCVMAPSGAGKTTLLQLIAGVERPDAGSVSFVARDGSEGAPAPPTMSIIMQDSTLLAWATPLENIALVARDDAEICRGHEYLLEVLDESDLVKPASTLSGGMKRRAELCRALVHRGQLVIADEPFSGLDEATKARCATLIDQAISGRTLLVATHDEDDAELLGARIIRL